jgi:hypothetical protein
MFKEGDKVFFHNEKDKGIPYGSIGTVSNTCPLEVEFNDTKGDNKIWGVLEEEITLIEEAPSDINILLNIPKEIKGFNGEYTDSNGDKWYVSANRISTMLLGEGVPKDVR